MQYICIYVVKHEYKFTLSFPQCVVGKSGVLLCRSVGKTKTNIWSLLSRYFARLWQLHDSQSNDYLFVF